MERISSNEFELWLEFEHVADPIDDFCNIRVELKDTTAYGLNVWTFEFLLNALQSTSDPSWPELAVGYSRAPDLFVRELTRPTITAAIADMIANGGLPTQCLDKPDFVGGEASEQPDQGEPSTDGVKAGSEPVWQVVDDPEYTRLWDDFEATFSFNPGAWRDRQPVIDEPVGSVTFDLEHASDTWAVHAINALVVWALAQVSADRPLFVMDWQHPAYRFWPHRSVLYGKESPFPFGVFPFPDGDYYAFVSEDLSEGTFGHPLEPSLCVFGDRLVPILRAALAPFVPIKRDA